MISNLLDSTRIQAGKLVALEISKTDLLPLLGETLHNLATIHGDRFILEASQPVQGFWCKDAIVRIVENLATNAVKYGDRSPITIQASQSSSAIEISVHNLGNPILLEDQSGLFKLFKRSESAEVGTQKGWGIGLVLVKGLVLAQRGSIRLKSDPQTGTTFTVSLPLDSRNEKVENENG